MSGGRFFSRLQSTEIALGALALSSAPEPIETLGAANYDFVVIDHQLAAIGWKETAHLIRAADGCCLTPFIRTESNPWVGEGTDSHAPAYYARCFSLGAAGILPSVRDARGVEQALDAASNWKQKIWVMSMEDEQGASDLHLRPVVMPLLESIDAFSEIDDIMMMPELEYVMVACTDVAKQLGHPFDYEHPEVWSLIDKVVTLGERYNVAVGANTGYKPPTLEQQSLRARRLKDHGVRVILTQSLEFILQVAAREVVRGARDS